VRPRCPESVTPQRPRQVVQLGPRKREVCIPQRLCRVQQCLLLCSREEIVGVVLVELIASIVVNRPHLGNRKPRRSGEASKHVKDPLTIGHRCHHIPQRVGRRRLAIHVGGDTKTKRQNRDSTADTFTNYYPPTRIITRHPMANTKMAAGSFSSIALQCWPTRASPPATPTMPSNNPPAPAPSTPNQTTPTALERQTSCTRSTRFCPPFGGARAR